MKFLIFAFIAFCGTGICPSQAQETITFSPQDAKIIGSIPYSIIGKYRAQFKDFKGRITMDGKNIRSVYLEIEAGSIRSNHPGCDRLARSRRLLNTARYPKIIFKSDMIIHDESGYEVKGTFEMHGIKRKMMFPFKVRIAIDQTSKRELLDLQGVWIINRKDFNIIWNKYLDQGGIVVGDLLTVAWGLRIPTHIRG